MATETAGITDEAIERLRARIGVAEPHPQPPHYGRPDVDAFRHVANAYGDDNPLYTDPTYATGTRWEGPIAPPVLVGGDTLIGDDEITELDDETRALLKGDPLRGVHAFYSASAREWWGCSTSRASSPSAPCTSGPARSSATTPAPCCRRSTG
jgi:hypothetical protein